MFNQSKKLKYLVLIIGIPSHALKFVPRMYMDSGFHFVCLTTYVMIEIDNLVEL